MSDLPLGIRPVASSDGTAGYTVRDAAALLGIAENTVRKRAGVGVEGGGMRVAQDHPLLLHAGDVLEHRRLLLDELGATEANTSTPSDPGTVVETLRQRVVELEEVVRLLLAARAEARSRTRHELSEQAAYDELILGRTALDPSALGGGP